MSDLTSVLLPTALAAHLTPQEMEAQLSAYLAMKADYARRGISYGGFTTRPVPPHVAPVHVRFKDVATGRWIEGLSEPKIDPNHFRIHLKVEAYAPCLTHAPVPCGCSTELVGLREGPANLATSVFSNWVRTAILGTNTTITDVTGAGRALTSIGGTRLDGGINSLLGCAGTGVTAAAVADVNMQTQTETQATVTVSTNTEAGTSGTFTVTFTITATAARAYTEVGLKAITATTAYNFLMFHDSFAVLNVSNAGTLATTYTVTYN